MIIEVSATLQAEWGTRVDNDAGSTEVLRYQHKESTDLLDV